jgi:hypothetical protein
MKNVFAVALLFVLSASGILGMPASLTDRQCAPDLNVSRKRRILYGRKLNKYVTC